MGDLGRVVPKNRFHDARHIAAFSGPPTDAASRLNTQQKRLIENELHDCRSRTMWNDLGGFRLFGCSGVVRERAAFC